MRNPVFYGTKCNRRLVMKKNCVAAIISCVIIGMSVTGCTIDKATAKATNFDKKPVAIVKERPYDVLGPVTLEKDWFGVLGFTTPTIGTIPPSDNYFYQKGGITYVDLLEEAKKSYADADAVIDINIDFAETRYFIFYASRKNIMAGIAIKYIKSAKEAKETLPLPAPNIDWSFSVK
jgi:hypothetical protein